MITDEIRRELFKNADEKFGDFQAKLMPTVAREKIIGVRTPILRKFAKELAKGEINDFLADLPHEYFEENNLHGFIISEIKDFDDALKRTNEFLPFIDNWATCDQTSPKAFKKNREKLKEEILRWLDSDATYTIRFGIEMTMTYFLGDGFDLSLVNRIAEIESEEYYVNMMIAWYFATALAKNPDETMPFIENKILPVWVHNKTIQKAVESYRIPDETKAYLKTLKSAQVCIKRG